MAARTTSPRLRLAGAMLSATGPVRAHNEDSAVFVSPSDEQTARRDGSLALVADGMGGHAAGEVASGLAADVIRRVYYDLDSAVPDALRAAFLAANRVIFEYAAANPQCSGMGTTATALAFHDDKIWLAHVGDSRAYLLRKGSLAQLSKDQTLVAKLIQDGVMTQEEAATSPMQNVILQALGVGLEVAPVVWKKGMPLQADDVLILCSDGLSGMVNDADIAEIAGRHPPHEACEALIAAAIAAGGHDNVSVGVFLVTEGGVEGAGAGHTTRRIRIMPPATDEGEREGQATDDASDDLSAGAQRRT